MTAFRYIAPAVAKIEGKKSQARIGDIREILKILTQLLASDDEKYSAFFDAVEKKRRKLQKAAK